jgi:hypothetical protein
LQPGQSGIKSKQMWNVFEEDHMQPILSLALPFIKTAEVIYIPKLLSGWNSENHSKPLNEKELLGVETNYSLKKELFNPK